MYILIDGAYVDYKLDQYELDSNNIFYGHFTTKHSILLLAFAIAVLTVLSCQSN